MRSLVLPLLLAASSLVSHIEAAENAPIASWTAADADLNELAFSPDGKLLASADEAGDIKLWDAGSHKLVRTIASHRGRIGMEIIGGVKGIAFSPDGESLASIGGDEKVKVWNPGTGGRRKILGDLRYAMSIAYAPDGNTIAAVGDIDSKTALCLFDARSNRKPRILPAEGLDALAIAFSPDASLVATSGTQGQVLLWDVKTGKLALRIKVGGNLTLAVSFAPNGKTFAVGGAGGIKLFETKTGRAIGAIGGPETLLDLKFSPDGKQLAGSVREGGITVWDVAARKELVTFEGHDDLVRTLAFSPDGKQLASGDKGGVIKVWKIPGARTPGAEKSTGNTGANEPPIPADSSAITLRFSGIVRPGETGYNEERTSVRLRFGPGRWRGTKFESSIAWGNGNQGRDHWGVGAGEPTFASDVFQDAEGDYFVFSLNGTDWESDRVAALIRLTLPDGKPAVAAAIFPTR